MKIDLRGKNIYLTNTILSDITKIMEFEKVNNLYVGEYSKEKHLQLLRDKNCLHLSIKRLDNDQLAGHMILFGLTDKNEVLEFRRITIKDKGLGFGRDTIRLLKKLCFKIIGHHRLWLDVFDDNKRAIYLYESEGFVLDGVLRENVKWGDEYRSQRIYSILKHEWEIKEYTNN